MPKVTARARWALQTLDEAVGTAKDIMRDCQPATVGARMGVITRWHESGYMSAARRAVLVLTGAVALVEHVERTS